MCVWMHYRFAYQSYISRNKPASFSLYTRTTTSVVSIPFKRMCMERPKVKKCGSQMTNVQVSKQYCFPGISIFRSFVFSASRFFSLLIFLFLFRQHILKTLKNNFPEIFVFVGTWTGTGTATATGMGLGLRLVQRLRLEWNSVSVRKQMASKKFSS